MGRAKRMERVVALTKILVDHPQHLFSFSYFCKKFEVAKSTLSEDVLAVKNGLELFGLGKVETLAGAAGGVRFIPGHSVADDNEFLKELALKLSSSDRILPGGMLYVTDILCSPHIVVRLGEIFRSRLQHLAIDYVMTVETRGISLALLVARAFNVPLVMARHDNYFTEGPTVNINYVSGSAKEIRTMGLPKRALQPGSRILVVDDEDSLRISLACILELEGYCVKTAEDGYKAIELAKQEDFDIVLKSEDGNDNYTEGDFR